MLSRQSYWLVDANAVPLALLNFHNNLSNSLGNNGTRSHRVWWTQPSSTVLCNNFHVLKFNITHPSSRQFTRLWSFLRAFSRTAKYFFVHMCNIMYADIVKTLFDRSICLQIVSYLLLEFMTLSVMKHLAWEITGCDLFIEQIVCNHTKNWYQQFKFYSNIEFNDPILLFRVFNFN